MRFSLRHQIEPKSFHRGPFTVTRRLIDKLLLSSLIEPHIAFGICCAVLKGSFFRPDDTRQYLERTTLFIKRYLDTLGGHRAVDLSSRMFSASKPASVY